MSYIFSCAVSDLLKSKQVYPDYISGYSMGIYAALYCGQSVTFTEGLDLIKKAFELIKLTTQEMDTGMASIVGVYRDGQIDSRSYTYRDQYNPRKDDWSLYYKKVKIVKVTSEIISILAINRDGDKDDMTFYLEAKSKPETKRPRISQKEKETFESHVKSEMKRISDAYQHNHPLFTRQTQINEHIIAHELKIAAFVLFEQIDTDRCTLEGSGWLGDQYRNSIWVIKNKEQAIQLFEDHAYTKQRGCDIRGLRIFEGKIFATNWEGKDLILKILNKTKNK